MSLAIVIGAIVLMLLGARRHRDGERGLGVFLVILGFVLLFGAVLEHHDAKAPDGEETYTPSN